MGNAVATAPEEPIARMRYFVGKAKSDISQGKNPFFNPSEEAEHSLRMIGGSIRELSRLVIPKILDYGPITTFTSYFHFLRALEISNIFSLDNVREEAAKLYLEYDGLRRRVEGILLEKSREIGWFGLFLESHKQLEPKMRGVPTYDNGNDFCSWRRNYKELYDKVRNAQLDETRKLAEGI